MSMVYVQAMTDFYKEQAKALAETLNLPMELNGADFALQLGEQGLQLQILSEKNTGAIRVDFVSGASAHRRQFGGGRGQMIAKAVGITPSTTPSVLDVTAGLGGDAFVLATLGCNVILIERQPLIHCLLADGLVRALQDETIASIIARMQLLQAEAVKVMREWSVKAPQVIYLDPMFPHRDKTALVKKEMRLFRTLVGDDLDARELFNQALVLASHRIVVKRPRKAPCIDDHSPSYVLEGKSSRYDIYVKQSFKNNK